MDLRDLYQEVILDHNRSPRNYGELPAANRSADGFNPLCGDRVTVALVVDDAGIIQDLRFHGSGCAISTASASLLTEALRGRPVSEAVALTQRFHEMVTTDGEISEEQLGKLAVFAGIRDYPARVKCATLAWHTLKAALENHHGTVSTE